MNWTHPTPDRIESAAGTVLREGGSYFAFGPPGSQDVSYIAAATAQVLHDLCGIDREPETLKITHGAQFLGRHKSADEAKRACEGWQTKREKRHGDRAA
jgi:hypothetical protein